MRVLFLGTPAFAVPTLSALLAHGHDVAAVVTQPDRARTRSHSTLLAPPVKELAFARNIAVLQPERPRGEEFYAAVRACNADLGVVVAYGHLLRPELLAIPRLGFVNVHASLLPRWRGAAPVHWAILEGDAVTGVSIMRVEAGLDSGAVWHTRRTGIEDDDTAGSLMDRLAGLGAEALIETLPRVAGFEPPVPQPTEGVTLAPKIDRELARVRWDEAAPAVARRIRAMDPAPGAWSALGDVDVKLTGARVREALPSALPGSVAMARHALLVATGDGAVEIDQVQPSGKRRMPAIEWWRGVDASADLRFT